MTDTTTPPLGGFQEIDGRRLFVHRIGRGEPAVVFLPGAAAVGLDYLGVAERVSSFTTAVLYDRGGTGYSDPTEPAAHVRARGGSPSRTATAVATELHALLHALDLAAPYVLVAHSLGGLYAHRFAQLHPQEVAGLVWLDAFHRDWDAFMPASLAEIERAAPDREQLDRMRPSLRDTFTELAVDVPAPLRRALVEAKVSDAWTEVGIAERSGLAELAAELQAGPDVPDVPVIALSEVSSDPAARAMNEGRARMDAAVVDAVSRGEQRLVADTEHHRLAVDRPDLVVQAVRDVLDRAPDAEAR